VDLPSLTGLRAVAAWAVFANHVADIVPGTALDEQLQVGRLGVSFFFILSGFVLAWVHRPGDPIGSFYLRRIARVLPNHVVAWAIAMVLLLALADGPFSVLGVADPLGAVLSLPLLQAWHPSSDVHFAVNAVAWSLSCEMFFYLVFPVVDRLVGRLDGRARAELGVALVVAPWAIAVAAHVVLPMDLRLWAVYVLPISRLPEFLLGVVAAHHLLAGGRVVPLPLAVGAVGAALVVAPHLPLLTDRVAIGVAPFTLLVLAVAAADASGRPTPLRSRPFAALGRWSYAFYLVHVGAIVATVVLLPDDAPAVLVVGVAFATTTAASALLHAGVERPAQAWILATVRRDQRRASRYPGHAPRLDQDQGAAVRNHLVNGLVALGLLGAAGTALVVNLSVFDDDATDPLPEFTVATGALPGAEPDRSTGIARIAVEDAGSIVVDWGDGRVRLVEIDADDGWEVVDVELGDGHVAVHLSGARALVAEAWLEDGRLRTDVEPRAPAG
jgi:peptidoglycan/LPS O-acetylase OafA/YrhL